MKKIIIIISLILIPKLVFGAIDADTIWEFRSTATANMVNGGGYNSTAVSAGTDYSQQDSAQLALTDLASTSASGWLTLTSTTGGFTAAMIGNIIRIASGTNFTAGWYEITAYTNTNTVTVDRACGTVADASVGVGKVGGALNVGGSLEDDFFEQCVAGNIIYFMGAVTYTPSEAISLTIVGTSTLPIRVIGYNTIRGDNPTLANRPTIAVGASSITFNDFWYLSNLIFTGTGTNVVVTDGGSFISNCKSTNSSATADRNAYGNSAAAGGTFYFNTEGISTAGDVLDLGAVTSMAIGCYFHDSKNGVNLSTGDLYLSNSIIDTNTTNAINISSNGMVRGSNNTLYGAEIPTGVGINLSATAIKSMIYNTIIYGFTTGISQTTAQLKSNFGDYNNFYNNTTDVTNYTKGSNDIALDPGFTDAVNADFRVGANMKAVGFPGSFANMGAGASCIGYLDIGAVQRVEPSGGGGARGARFLIQ